MDGVGDIMIRGLVIHTMVILIGVILTMAMAAHIGQATTMVTGMDIMREVADTIPEVENLIARDIIMAREIHVEVQLLELPEIEEHVWIIAMKAILRAVFHQVVEPELVEQQVLSLTVHQE